MASQIDHQKTTQNGSDVSEIGLGQSLLKSNDLYQYILQTSVYPREPACLKELREIASNHPWSYMLTPPEEAQFLNLLVKLINAKNTLEIGVYVGFSALATALALPDDGKILAMDVNRENFELGLPIMEKAGVAHKIDFREGPALPLLDQLVADENNLGTFDFVFVDADKSNYLNYHKRLLELVKVGGVIAYDNTLWLGTVVSSLEDSMVPERAQKTLGMDKMKIHDYIKYNIPFVKELNKTLAEDPRIEICQLPIGDGFTICRKIK